MEMDFRGLVRAGLWPQQIRANANPRMPEYTRTSGWPDANSVADVRHITFARWLADTDRLNERDERAGREGC